MSREYPSRPFVAVGGLIFKGEKALLVRRAKDPGRGQWSIPGGAIEVGETLHQALSREMREETNLAVEIGPLVEAVDRIVHDAEGNVMFHYIVVDYLCFAPAEEPRPGSDVSEVCFASAKDWPGFGLDRLALDTLHKALDMVRK
jgi:ADP-ribose pyrophosphatase YjhB (NUDIX family)